MPSWLLAGLTALSTSLVAVASNLLASNGVFCGASGETPASVSAAQQWLQPQADALTTHCNGVCPGLCVFRASTTGQCTSNSSASNYLSPQCVRGRSCVYECVASTTTSRAPLRWSILQARDGLATIETATTTTTTTSGLTTRNITRLTSAIRRLARLELPGNVVELSVVGDNTMLLDADATALTSYQSLVKLELVSVDVPDVWTRLPRMANLQSLSLVDASLVQWPLEDAGDSIPAIETLDLHINPGLQLSSGAFSSSLRRIDLSSCGLTDLPADLVALASLRSLTLDRNPLTTVSSVDSALPSALEYLSLRNCSLPRSPDGLTSLTRLLSLDLAYNPRVGASLDVLALPLTSLLTLDLSHCQLASFAFNALASSPLRTLRLAGSTLPAASLQTFTTTGALVELDLSSTDLKFVPTAVTKSTTLRVVNLAGNPLASLAAWPALSTLTSLNVSSAGLTSLPDASSASLDTLDASFNALTSLPQGISASERLRVLNVTRNPSLRITSLPSSLGELLAANCSLSSLPALNWTALHTVDLSFNALSQLTIETQAATAVDGFSFRDLSTTSSSTGSAATTARHLRLNLRSNKLSSFPSALVSLSAMLSELDLRGNPFSPPLRLTTEQFTLLDGLDVLRIDSSSLDTSCDAAKLKPLTIATTGSVSVCVDDEPLTPGTVAPSTDKAANSTDSSGGGGGGGGGERATASAASNRTAMVATAAVGGFVLAMILVGLIVVYRRSSKPGASTRGGDDARARNMNRTQFALTGISLPTREPHEFQSLPKSRALSNAPPPSAYKHSSQGATTSLDSQQSDGMDLDLDLDLGDSIVATLDVEAAALLEDISDDLDFISWRIRPRHVTLGAHVATGTSCFVYRATLVRYEAVAASSRRNATPPSHHQHAIPTIIDVAVKKLPPHQTRTDVDAIERLAREVRVLAPFQHPKIVAFLGVSWTQRLDLQIVLEWMPDGDLRTLLSRQAAAKRRRRASVSDRWLPSSLSFSFGSSSSSPTTSPSSSSSVFAGGRALRIATDVAEALAFVHAQSTRLLHQRRHWRLTTHKVVLDASLDVAKLCDFGSSAKDREAFAHLRRWLAPELLAGDAHSVTHADVYALGLLLAELDTFELPFQRVLRHKSLGDGRDDPMLASERALLRGLVRGDVEDMGPLLLSDSCPPAIGDLVRWCTCRQPADRPSAGQVLRVLRRYAASAGGREEDERRTKGGAEEEADLRSGRSFFDAQSSGYSVRPSSVRPSSVRPSSVDKRRSSSLWI